jgi:curved DNA-binding protein CbpA
MTTNINYSTLKYNLYEILNVDKLDHCDKIKKNYIKLIKKFHPDKTLKIEEEIYYHIIIAGQILLNEKLRYNYDNYINNYNINNHIELKNNFVNTNKIESQINLSTDHIKLFEKKFNELNLKHGYNETIYNQKTIEKFDKQKSNRINNDICINNIDYKTKDDFNKEFKKNKLKNEKNTNQIIESTYPVELSTYIIGELYTNLDDIDKLYIDDSVQSSIFTSLDRAFILQPEVDIVNIDSDNKLKKYKCDTNIYNNRSISDYSKLKFSDWYL